MKIFMVFKKFRRTIETCLNTSVAIYTKYKLRLYITKKNTFFQSNYNSVYKVYN